jgi:pantoate--beta-alanine ligase
VTKGLCGAARPGHFDGVTTVVAKLLLQTRADAALFGEKDYQQLTAVRRMVQDLNIPCTIVPVATVREVDGLAMSSRNAYLLASQRALAPKLYATLRSMAERLESGRRGPDEVVAWGRGQLEAAGFDAIDYVELRAADLGPWRPEQSGRLLAAIHLGETRLIDNVPVAALADPP